MMRSMYSGVSGLRIHQTKMDVIGNNIANVNTVGFKSSRATFSEIFSQTVQGASGANQNKGGTNPIQIGLGATLGSIDVNMTEGASQRTDNPLDLKIEGEGFFVVSDVTGNKFTRAGAFNIDSVGNLVTSGGLNLMGWGVNATTNEIEKNKVDKLQILSADNIFSEPEKTSKAIIAGNINMNDLQLDPTEDGVPFTMTIYDSLGYSYTAAMKVQETGTDNEYNITLADITDQNGVPIGNGTTPDPAGTIKFDEATGKITGPTTFDITGLDTDNSEFSDIAVDFSSLTMFSGNTTIEARAGDTNGQGSGNKAGTISGYEINNVGKIIGQYTNGSTKLLGQIAIADFDNPAGLRKEGNNLFTATSNSGEFDGIGIDISSNGGAINSGVLEMSNVDLSTEFTEMITTQRGFQANSRIITSSDEMLQELVNLKR